MIRKNNPSGCRPIGKQQVVDYGGHRFKARLNRRLMVAGFVGLQEGYSGSGWDSASCHVSTIPPQLPFLPFSFARRDVDQLTTTSCKDYEGHSFKPRFNHRPMVAGSVGLQEGHSGSG